MSAQRICQIHGPYDAKEGSCPYCARGSGGRPVAPAPLEEDNLPSNVNFQPYQNGAPGGVGEYEPTKIPGGGSSKGILDFDDDPTVIRTRSDEKTEIFPSNKGEVAVGILWVKEGSEGPKRGRIYKLVTETVIGRTTGNLALDDRYVSNPHAKLVYKEDHFVIGDFMTDNGTFVNGEQIQQQTTLKENDLIKIGTTIFVLKVLA
jgi:hypothetical protein